MYQKTVYANDKITASSNLVLDENIECQIVIVGGGLAGLSLAYQLAYHNQDFVLIEAATIGDSASGMNGGFCSPGWSIDLNTLIRKFGFESAKWFYGLSVEGLKWVESFKNRTGFKMMAVKPGVISLSLLKNEKLAHAAFLENNAINRDEYEFIPQDGLKKYVRSNSYQSGILSKSGFSFNPLNFLIGLKNEINFKRPRAIFEKSKMESFFEYDHSIRVNLENGVSIITKKLIFATGGYGGSETGFLRTRWLPLTTSISVTPPLKKEVTAIINPQFAFSDDRRAGNYFRLIDNNRLLWGRGFSAFGAPNRKMIKKLAQLDIQKFFPNLWDITTDEELDFEFIWSGKMSYSKSMMPYVGKLTANTYALTGFGGHGMNTAPGAAIVLAEHLLGLSDRISTFKKIPLTWNGNKFGSIGAELLYIFMAAKDSANQKLLSVKKC